MKIWSETVEKEMSFLLRMSEKMEGEKHRKGGEGHKMKCLTSSGTRNRPTIRVAKIVI